jgi:dynein light chain 4, axonemal
MKEDMQAEAIEVITTACEKYAQNYELAAKTIKEAMDKKFGIFWHVVVGEGFGFEGLHFKILREQT